MDQIAGAGHAAMDSAMSAMTGEQGSKAMHVALGERYSGCVPNAALPNGSWGGMMRGGWSTPWSNNYGFMPMMNYGYGYGGWSTFGFLWMVLWWVVIVIGVIAVVRWLARGHRHDGYHTDRSPLDILKERYARGELDKKEFEERKKGLGS